jgi:DNA-directed RNA polymerase subunit RPC12/RpoP
MIAFAGPNPDCRTKYRVSDDKAGKETVCARCRWRIRVPVPPPPAPAVVADLLDEETGATFKDWRTQQPAGTAPPVPDEPSPATHRGGLTELRCYDCGSRIHEGEHVRRNVAVGDTWWAGSVWGGSGTGGGHWSQDGIATHYGRVDLCEACAAARNEAARRTAVTMLLVSVVVGAAMLCAGIFLALH